MMVLMSERGSDLLVVVLGVSLLGIWGVAVDVRNGNHLVQPSQIEESPHQRQLDRRREEGQKRNRGWEGLTVERKAGRS